MDGIEALGWELIGPVELDPVGPIELDPIEPCTFRIDLPLASSRVDSLPFMETLSDIGTAPPLVPVPGVSAEPNDPLFVSGSDIFNEV